MNKLYTLLLFTFCFNTAFSQCEETDVPRVLLIGDSWANFMNDDQTINDVLNKWGHSNYTYYSSIDVAVNGAETPDFLEPSMQAEIESIFAEHPTIDFVHLSIGGNDVMGDWDITFSAAETQQLEDEVSVRLRAIIDFLKNARPGVKILWSGYCYPNFGEVIENFAPFQSGHPFYGTWEGMDFPEFIQINNLLNDFNQMVIEYTDTTPDVDFYEASGLMQYTFGQEEPLGIAPGGTYPPMSVPMPHGDPNYPSPIPSMRDYGLLQDCFHLSPAGYFALVDYHAQKYYHKALMDDHYVLATDNASSGSISSAGSVTENLYLGADSTADHVIQLNFNTTSMEDFDLEAASIFLRRESIIGGDPTLDQDLQIKLKSGMFGASMDVEATDLVETPDYDGMPCSFGSTGGVGHWLRIDLPEDALQHITNSSETQFQIMVPNVDGQLVEFSGTSDPEFAPVLNLNYVGSPETVAELAKPEVSIYPNPAVNSFRVQGTAPKLVEVLDVRGSVVHSSTERVISVDGLNHGVYLVRITGTDQQVSTVKLIKN